VKRIRDENVFELATSDWLHGVFLNLDIYAPSITNETNLSIVYFKIMIDVLNPSIHLTLAHFTF
jgi:hypothetical protein